jgi:hypothetical protein
MAAFESALGPIAWILHEGLRAIGGRLAIALFGDAAELLSDGAPRLRAVPGLSTGGGTAFAADALELATHTFDMTNPRRPRFAYVASNGDWYDTAAGVACIHELRAHGVPTIHVAIGCAPLSVDADRARKQRPQPTAREEAAQPTGACAAACTHHPRRRA